MRRYAIPLALLVLVAAGCGGKQKAAATAPVPAGLSTTNVGGVTATVPRALVTRFLSTCAEGQGSKRKDYCGCVLKRLQATTSPADFRLIVTAGRTPPPSLQQTVKGATTVCKSRLR
jgi:hypothetical protein